MEHLRQSQGSVSSFQARFARWTGQGAYPTIIRMPSQPIDKSSLSIERTQRSGHIVLIVSGRMDAENAPQFEEKCTDCIAEGHSTLVADLSGLAYVSSMGLRTFLSVAKTLQGKGGVLRLCGLKGLVKQVFEITGLLPVFSVYESVESAALGG
jgi:anti-anti-sigma factor